MHILLTGFEPWGKSRINPSGEVARALGGHVLPVDYEGAERKILRLILAKKPDAILMLGLARRRTRISLEARARNEDFCGEGPWSRSRRPIRTDGTAFLETRLPIARLRRRLGEEGIAASLSRDAGRFICNHVFYVALEAARGPCGFVHLPPFTALPRSRQTEAVRILLEALAAPSGARRSGPPRGRSPRS